MSFHEKPKKQVRKVGQYILGETLGKDGYSWTQKGVDEKTKIPVILKFVIIHNKQSFQEQLKDVYSGIMSLIKINNPHMIKLVAYNLHCKYPEKNGKILNTIVLVYEHCPGGELFDILYYTHQLDSVTARTYFIQMLKGLWACHNAGVAHGDIKPQNLLLDRHYQLKITNFGMSFNAEQKKDFKGMLNDGTESYQAPELLKGKKYTKASDIFSCGVILFILLTGHHPFESARREDKWYRPMCESNPAAFWKLHKAKIDDDCKDLLTGMLAYRARERLTLDECLKHIWVAGRKTHNPQDLAALVNEKHKQTRMRRRNNWTKMQDLEKSVKQRKRILWNLTKWQNAQVCRKTSCPCCNSSWDVSSSKRTLPVVENFVPNLLTFFAWKFQLHEAYDAAVNVFNVALEGKSHTVNSPGNPWDVTTFIKVSNGVFQQEFAVSLSIREIKETGIVAFKYNRFLGDSISFYRIWDAAEECLMSYSQNVFFDSLDEQIMMEEDNKEQSHFVAVI